MLSSLDIEYASVPGRFRASVVPDDGELLRNVARFTTLISTRHDNIDGAHLVEGETDTANLRSGEPIEPSGAVTIDRDWPAVE